MADNNEKEKKPKLLKGGFKFATAIVGGTVVERHYPELDDEGNVTGTISELHQGPDFLSRFVLKEGRHISGLGLEPSLGTSLGAQGDLRIKDILTTAEGDFSRERIIRGDAVVSQIVRMNGAIRMRVKGVTGIGQMEFAPCPGASFAIGVGGQER